MNTHDIRRKYRLLFAGLLASLFTGMAQGMVQEITAQFRPDPSNPNQNRFTNTTPVTGFCQTYPAHCPQMFSIRLPISAHSSVALPANPADPRQSALWRVPAQWRELRVVDTAGNEEVVEIRISGFGSRYLLDRSVVDLVGGGVSVPQAHGMLWGGGWLSAAPPCVNTSIANYTGYFYTFFWKTPVEGACTKVARYEIPVLQYQFFEIAYELRTPNPLSMRDGIYTGTLSYGIGPHQDFDFGDIMLPNDPVLTFNFTLSVEHQLKVELPPGGNRVILQPQGGWQTWLNQGRLPTRLFRDQTFSIYSSGRFRMNLECGLAIGNTCGLSNSKGDQVPLQVGVSLPFGLNDQYGQSISKRALHLDGSGTELVQATHYVSNRPGTLHFEVAKDDVEQMLKTPGSTYSGLVTVVWDSEV
ncbi:hypothetical protein C4J95_1112 [Pseudomonas orientalis]|uniref:hypothetical protein n=1 Tax=Pseudomonas orientalis TaxID=76758 RepID=UPI000F715317|nr:hypothetical protein [Pseudomonas orientalis]AZE93238.1 hypothetical protein C4J96_1104 [Pseudomonas orientalis]AZE98590.1 hypothetical protein C4J95_1112 [Pseudomonas orientalis]